MAQNSSKIIIVGAGVIGVAIACRLVRAGHDVTLIDRETPGRGASFGNAGHFATEQFFPLASPDTLRNIPKMMFDQNGPLVIKPAYMLTFLPWSLRFLWASRPSAFRRGIAATRSLNQHALAAWVDLLSDCGLTDLIRQRGSVEIFQTAKAFRKAPALAADFARHDIPVEILEAPQVRKKIPALTGAVAGALYFPATAHTVNPHRLVTAIFEKAVARGLRFIQDDITAVQKSGPGITLTGVKDRYRPDKLIIAAGVFSKPLVRTLGYDIPLEAERGYHYMMPEPHVALTLPVTFHERKFILTPMEHGIRLAGTVEYAGTDAPPTPGRARMLYDFARKSFPALDASGAEEWMGRRPTLPDFLPVIDRRDDILFAFGHHHLGLTQAAITARLVADLVAGEPPEIDLSPFRLDRF